MNWSAYPFALLAILVIGGLALPSGSVCPEPVCEDGKQCYDYYAETYQGRYTGQWWVHLETIFKSRKYTFNCEAWMVIARSIFLYIHLPSSLYRNPNTLSCFDRVPAVIMNCGGQKVYSFKVDEKPSDWWVHPWKLKICRIYSHVWCFEDWTSCM